MKAKAIIIALALIIVALIGKNLQQKQILNNIQRQAVDMVIAYEQLLDIVEEENENFVLDVITETDSYATYMDYCN